jgi:lipopolysaccharide transport system ATP-binding protein
VLAVGDASFQKKCLGKMDRVARDGRTVLFVSHNMPTILSLCNRVLLLRGGRLVAEGPPSRTVQEYLESVLKMSGTPLDQRNDRSGDGSARFTGIQTASMDPDGIIRSGSRLRIVVHYRSDGPVRHPQFVVSIYDQMNVGLFVLHNEMGGGLPSVLPAAGSVTCITDPINLTPGRCLVHLELLKGNVRADYISTADVFDVEADDSSGSGILPTRNWAMCLVPHAWSLNQN